MRSILDPIEKLEKKINWLRPKPNLTIGDLAVTKMNLGKDQLVTETTIKIAEGTYIQQVIKLALIQSTASKVYRLDWIDGTQIVK